MKKTTHDIENFIINNFYDLISYGGCACGKIYVKDVMVETHCHKAPCQHGCEFGGIHVGKYWDSDVDLKYLSKKLKPMLTKQWNTDFKVVILGDVGVNLER